MTTLRMIIKNPRNKECRYRKISDNGKFLVISELIIYKIYIGIKNKYLIFFLHGDII